jgi:tetratricopeptide (TPR) repeat protein
MNPNLVAVIKRIIAEEGEDIFANPARLKGYVADYAAAESKAERLAFGRCIEYGAYNELKSAADRQAAKAALARRVNANEGIDLALCNGVLDALEAALYEEEKPKKGLCLACGKELEEGWTVCPFCGAGMSASAVGVTVQSSAVAQPAVLSPSGATTQTQPPQEPGKKHMVRNVLIAAGVLLMAVAVIGGILPAVKTSAGASHFQTAQEYLRNEDYQNAKEEYLKALKADKKYLEGEDVDEFVWAMLTQPDDNLRIDFADRVVGTHPNEAKAYKIKGDAYFWIGDTDTAILDYTRAIGLDPNYADAYAWRGWGYEEKGDWKNATADFEKASELSGEPAQMASFCRGSTIEGVPAEIYFGETTSKIDVAGITIGYWLFNTYKFAEGHGDKLFEIIFKQLTDAGLNFDSENMWLSPNPDLHKNIKTMMLDNDDGELHDVSVCLYDEAFCLNNYDRSTSQFFTFVIPFTRSSF